ncbi:MAG: HIT family hydrolase [Spirochaetia bacterium]|nr:HIT family hydrolase [Spirochaetia bacterium]
MDECKICKIHSNFQAIQGLQFENWIVRPAEIEKNCPGYHYIELKRHLTTYEEVDKVAWREYGDILHTLTSLIYLKYIPSKIYTVSIAEAVPHLHFHMIPRYIESPIGMEYLSLALKGELPLL